MAALQQRAPNNNNSAADFEALARNYVAEGGPALLQQHLKDIIAKNKQLDSEVLKQRKLTDAAVRTLESDGLKQHRAVLADMETLRIKCGGVIKENTQIQQLLDLYNEEVEVEIDEEEPEAAAAPAAAAEAPIDQNQPSGVAVIESDDDSAAADEKTETAAAADAVATAAVEQEQKKKKKKKKTVKRPFVSESMQHYYDFRQRFEAQVKSIRDSAQKQVDETAALNAETATLRAEFDAKRAAFEKSVADKIDSFKGEDQERQEEIMRVHTSIQRFDHLSRLLEHCQAEAERNAQEKVQAEEAVALYTEKTEQMQNLKHVSLEAANNYAQMEEMLRTNVAALEKEKARMADTERQMREAVHKMRNEKMKQLRKGIQHLEKEKSALETKSRTLLQKQQQQK